MKLIQCDDIARFVNAEHIVSVYVDKAYKNGKPLDGYWQVVAKMTFGNGTEILFIGRLEECFDYIKNLKEV